MYLNIRSKLSLQVTTWQFLNQLIDRRKTQYIILWITTQASLKCTDNCQCDSWLALKTGYFQLCGQISQLKYINIQVFSISTIKHPIDHRALNNFRGSSYIMYTWRWLKARCLLILLIISVHRTLCTFTRCPGRLVHINSSNTRSFQMSK